MSFRPSPARCHNDGNHDNEGPSFQHRSARSRFRASRSGAAALQRRRGTWPDSLATLAIPAIGYGIRLARDLRLSSSHHELKERAMSRNKKRSLMTVAATVLIAGAGAYAAAQQHPANESEASGSCPHECKGECMTGGGMMGGGMMGGGMHGGGTMGNMHGDKSGGVTGAGMGEGASCPMMDMRALADIQIENTKSGAVIRVNAKKAEQVSQIQKLAQRMTQCMSHAETAPSKPAAASANHTH
jgi:hypothetical protein